MNSKLSDNFSFIDDVNTGKSAEHNFQFLPNMDNNVDYSMSMKKQDIFQKNNNQNQRGGRPKSRKDLRRDKFDNDFEKLQRERDSLTNSQRVHNRMG